MGNPFLPYPVPWVSYTDSGREEFVYPRTGDGVPVETLTGWSR